MAQTNALARGTNAAPATPQPAATTGTNSVAAATNRPAYTYVRVVPRPVDPEKAKAAKAETVRRTVEFQKKRADEGSESAQYELGVRYLKGDGVEKDEALGRKWLAESAKNGFTPAAKKLEELDKPPKSAPDQPAAEPKEKPVVPVSQ